MDGLVQKSQQTNKITCCCSGGRNSEDMVIVRKEMLRRIVRAGANKEIKTQHTQFVLNVRTGR